MKFHFILLTVLIASLFTITACNKKTTNPRLQAPAEKISAIEITAGQKHTIPEPKVNILFVVDNSQSMNAHQAKLKANIDLFADKFFNNPRINYKIGVVPVYDRVYLNDTKIYGSSGRRKMNPLGELVSLKGKDGLSLENVPPYITRDTPNAKEVLKNTVTIGTQWGPEAEESFSPVMEIISNTETNNTINGGFYDKDAYLVVIFLTDADDVTPGVTSDEFYDYLIESKDGNENKILIAAALPSARKNSGSCRVDGNGPQYKFPALIARSNAIVADLCSRDFGKTLALFGEQLVEQVGSQRLQLDFIPDTNFVVSYGAKDSSMEERQIIQRDKNGYTYNPETQEIILSPNLNITRIPDGQIFIEITPARLSNIKNGRTTTTLQQYKASQKQNKKDHRNSSSDKFRK